MGPFLSRLRRALGLQVLDYQTISVAPNGDILQRVFHEVGCCMHVSFVYGWLLLYTHIHALLFSLIPNGDEL